MIPLAGQPSFELGVALFELAMGLEHLLGASYPVEGTTPEEFAAVDDYATLGQVAGTEYAAVVRGLLGFDAADRMSGGGAPATGGARVRGGGAAAEAARLQRD